MKKMISLLALAAVALSGCAKGSIEGTVSDAFTGKPVEGVQVQLKGTTLQPVVTDANGAFSFPEISIQKYDIVAGKQDYSKSNAEVVLTKENANQKVPLFVFNRKGMEAGRFTPSDTGAVKIPNTWVGFEVECGDGKLAYRTSMKIKRGKEEKVSDMPAPMAQPLNATYLLFDKSGAQALPEVKIASAKKVAAADVPACAAKAKDTKEFYVADMNAATVLPTTYKSTGLFEVTTALVPGVQVVYFYQNGKPLKGYLFDAK